ncbi:galactarate dehydratase [Arcobacter nitrofigilis DSM 7299]|uniref:Galactarate dehydratase n=1 Tax=Arcobacter nitrofigilis (strain ATCC 33309 / DSM 7299 / CCUG 15893 / LMG 7604 / NCTC 12251 / CI) TaxID=572480 RepID=D5V3B3_ARCNC|nr:galactarate dehydratase [Arcobacter nitrofigilis]ADG92695.1 galactarate dehydratase [Arcobacter nitrofigilis DSM 7299]
MKSETDYISIQINELDNVAVIVESGGLKKGAILNNGISLVDDIPQGHKVALKEFKRGDAVIRYGEVIGYVEKDLPKGSWIFEGVMVMPEAPKLEEYKFNLKKIKESEPLVGYTFEGYKNLDGSVGTRNILGITTSVQCVAGVLNVVVKKIKDELLYKYPNVDDVVALNHTYGCGVAIDAPAAIIPIRTVQNLAKNPNLGNEVLVLGLGCEKLSPDRLVPNNNLNPEEKVILKLHDFDGFEAMVSGIMALAEQKLKRLNKRKRETCPVSDLVIGMQCGGSDAFSGFTANPAVGFASDLIVRAGGTVLFSEVTEVRDGIQLLLPRVANEEVGKALIDEMQWYDDYLKAGSVDRSANTTPGNKAGGLSNIVEKSLGSIIKSGTSTIVDVLKPGEKVRKKGLVFAATPSSDFVCGTLQLSSGISMQVFTTGRGTPYGLAMAPVIKLSSRMDLSLRWHDLIDLDAGRIATGSISIADVGWELFKLILEVASGKKSAAERLGLKNDLVLFNPAPIT